MQSELDNWSTKKLREVNWNIDVCIIGEDEDE